MNESIDNESMTDRTDYNDRQRNGHRRRYTGAKSRLTDEELIADVTEQCLTLKAGGREQSLRENFYRETSRSLEIERPGSMLP